MARKSQSGRYHLREVVESRARRFDPGYSDIFAKRDSFEDLSSGELVGLRREASNLKTAHHRCAQRLGNLIDQINHALRSMEPDPVEVTDHAVIRYLERIAGMDIEAIRNTIADQCGGVATNSQDGRGMVVLCDGFLAMTTDNRVQTIIPDSREDPVKTPVKIGGPDDEAPRK